ncbi:MAG TPA: hypothetical protein VLF66_13295 [Thermoanaerobaculia bacterium]|nr:hypothetical protein [Thermoanaerobaculia bacterium]
MHECLDVPGWIEAWGDPGNEGRRLAACPRCGPSRRDLGAWLAAVRECPGCREALEAIPIESEEVVHCRRCMAAFDKLHEVLDELEHFDPGVASEVPVAKKLVRSLAKLEVSEQLARVREDLRYRQWALAQRLLGEARQAWSDDPELAHDRATVAVAVAGHLDPARYLPQWVADLRAKAHAYLANTHRILDAFAAAEREFLRAEHHLRRGVRSGRCQAQVLTLKASLLVDQQRFLEAGALLEGVEAYYRRAGDDRELARTRLKQAMVAEGQGDYRGAADRCIHVSSSLNPRQDRRLFVLARQNAVNLLTLAGDAERARELFDALPPAPDRHLKLRRHWVEGNLLRAEGELLPAREAYEEARRG